MAEAYNAYFADEPTSGVGHNEALRRARSYAEGERSRREANFFRRNPRLRQAAIDHYGLKCAVCQFDFGDEYGEHGRGFIEIHHLRSLAERRDLAAGAALETNVKDVAPLCANCHRMAHRGRTALPIEELKAIWQNQHIRLWYLDLYAAQLSWRLTRKPLTDEAGLASLMSAMLAPGRSPMAGYFLPRKMGGAKRNCQIIKPDGSLGEWVALSAEDRRRARRAAREARNDPPQPRVCDARSNRWNQGFTFLTADEFAQNPKLVPGDPGV